ncbi:MAG TPA: helix-turn-helix domain-containing protein [Sandaracinaceae bacterium LLY-WYZ-13_1]|nr:helix-turn-helix domain-containing protein [Sandaracinaceae bacterium LLY-WYZ-13_1]
MEEKTNPAYWHPLATMTPLPCGGSECPLCRLVEESWLTNEALARWLARTQAITYRAWLPQEDETCLLVADERVDAALKGADRLPWGATVALELREGEGRWVVEEVTAQPARLGRQSWADDDDDPEIDQLRRWAPAGRRMVAEHVRRAYGLGAPIVDPASSVTGAEASSDASNARASRGVIHEGDAPCRVAVAGRESADDRAWAKTPRFGARELPMDPFFPIPEVVARDRNLSPSAKLVFAVLVRRASSRGFAWPSNRSLAQSVGLGVSRTKEVLRELRQRGLIYAEKRPGRTSHYYLLKSPEFFREEATESVHVRGGWESRRSPAGSPTACPAGIPAGSSPESRHRR